MSSEIYGGQTVGAVPDLTNEQLVQRIQAGIDVKPDLERLWQQNKNFVYMIAKRYGENERDDMVQEGYFGLCEAVKHFDTSAGCSFISYAAYWIRQAMQRYYQINKTVHIPIHLQESISKYQRFKNVYRVRFGKTPTDQQACCYLGIKMKTLEKIKQTMITEKIGSTDKEIDGTEELTLGDVVRDPADHYESVLDDVQQEQLKEVLWPLVEELPGKAPEILRLRYQEGLSLKETGEYAGISSEAVRQWQSKGLRELRKPSRSNRLKPFYEDEIYSCGLAGNGVGNFNRTWTSSTERTAIRILEG